MTLMLRAARVRPSQPFWLIDESKLPSDPEHARRCISLMHIAGTSLAMGVIRNLLRYCEASSRAKHPPADSNAWPLSPTQVEGLRAALYFLRRYGDGLLEAERDR
ncbi:hypothetical protein [Dyella nitratireducens]|uniref:Transposase n=1 Tax=Dyella nitratireducens TaxID=1849580 RepID=A0ABQ1FJG9_9GAMM|nr:hypothetical protein [Dyella nitratireducens]GGA17004.1 hypothetical protein GCM10010981_00910 [Dyella nitratireducens]GLQ44848.1 hypothetical protein GCM10007902_46980 [Dyella nitratireducens]